MSSLNDLSPSRAATPPSSMRRSRSHSAPESREPRNADAHRFHLALSRTQQVALKGITPRYQGIRIRAKSLDGNALSVVSATARAMKAAGVKETEVEAYCNEALSGDYDHVIRTTRTYVNLV